MHYDSLDRLHQCCPLVTGPLVTERDRRAASEEVEVATATVAVENSQNVIDSVELAAAAPSWEAAASAAAAAAAASAAAAALLLAALLAPHSVGLRRTDIAGAAVDVKETRLARAAHCR